jgi:opacity protein-like surface antigen
VKHPFLALALAAPLAVLASSAAIADEQSGFYVGVGLGQFNVEVENLDDAGDTVDNFDGDSDTWKVFAGWRFMPFLALEVDYVDLGGPDDEVEGNRVEADIAGIAPYIVGTIPIGIFEIFAKVGYYFYDFEIKSEDIEDVLDESDEDLAYGGGVGITFVEHVNVRLEYEIIDVSNVDDANALWLTGAWRF